MMPENSKAFNGDDQPLRPGDSGNNDRPQDGSGRGAAADNAPIQDASQAAVPSYRLDDKNEDRESANDANLQPATTQGSEEEIEENLSGTTNLTLDQLKKVRDPGSFNLESEEPEGTES